MLYLGEHFETCRRTKIRIKKTSVLKTPSVCAWTCKNNTVFRHHYSAVFCNINLLSILQDTSKTLWALHMLALVCTMGKDFIALLWRWAGVFQVISSEMKLLWNCMISDPHLYAQLCTAVIILIIAFTRTSRDVLWTEWTKTPGDMFSLFYPVFINQTWEEREKKKKKSCLEPYGKCTNKYLLFSITIGFE